MTSSRTAIGECMTHDSTRGKTGTDDSERMRSHARTLTWRDMARMVTTGDRAPRLGRSHKSPIMRMLTASITARHRMARPAGEPFVSHEITGHWRSWLARFLDMEEVTGSSPVWPIRRNFR